MKKLHVDWTKHLRDPEAKANFEQLVRNSVQVLSRLRDILKERQDTLEAAELSVSDLETPSWALKQSNRLGKKAAYRDTDQLTSFLGG
jgi:hypothetical protein